MFKNKAGISLAQLVMAFVLVFASIFGWWALLILSKDSGGTLWILLICLIVAAPAFLILSAVEGTNVWLRRLALAVVFGSAAFLLFSSSIFFGITVAVLAFLISEFGSSRVEKTRDSLAQPRVRDLSSQGFRYFFYAVSLIIASALFFAPAGEKVLFNPVPKPVLDFTLRAADPFTTSLVGFSTRGSVDEILRSAGHLPANVDVKPLRDSLSKQFGIKLTGKEDLSTALYQAINVQSKRFEQDLGALYRLGFIVSAFFLFKFISLPLSWVALLPLVLMVEEVKILGGAEDVSEPSVKIVMRWK